MSASWNSVIAIKRKVENRLLKLKYFYFSLCNILILQKVTTGHFYVTEEDPTAEAHVVLKRTNDINEISFYPNKAKFFINKFNPHYNHAHKYTHKNISTYI